MSKKKEKGISSEFKKFIMRGNVIDLAVGVIIGGAFQKIVNSLVDDIIMPIISLITKGVDFTNWFVVLDGGKYDTLTQAQDAGAAVLSFGLFISAIINFFIMAAVIFFLVKGINSINEIGKKPQPEAAPTTKNCPFCMSVIDIKATRCPNCTSEIKE